MSIARIRRVFAAGCIWWWLGAILLSALQPFIAVHFNCDGWEDEPGFRIRAFGETTQFEPDDRGDHALDRETTLFAPLAASIDTPSSLHDGLSSFLAMLAIALPLILVLATPPIPRIRVRHERVPAPGGPPPPTAPWARIPPKAAPPTTG